MPEMIIKDIGYGLKRPVKIRTAGYSKKKIISETRGYVFRAADKRIFDYQAFVIPNERAMKAVKIGKETNGKNKEKS